MSPSSESSRERPPTMRPIVAGLLLAAWLVPSIARAGRLDEILAEMKKAGDRLTSLAADFQQTDFDFILKDEETSTGKLYLAVPGRLRWETAPPRAKSLVVKDGLARLYNPTANQVNEFAPGKAGKMGADLLVGFGRSNEKIRESYDVSLVGETEDTVVLDLVPKPESAASIFAKIELTLEKKTWTPVKSVFYESNRNHTEIAFHDVVLNGSLPDGIFELKLPAKVEIIRN
jgi:outer membrane lipoprotein-sorting protein